MSDLKCYRCSAWPCVCRDGITLIHGDCREVLPQIDKCDAIITDPPYGMQDLGGGYGRRQLHSANGRDGRTIANDCNLDVFHAICSEAKRLLSPAGWLIAFCGARRRHDATGLVVGAELEPYGEYVWDKARPGLGYTIRYSHETALVARLGEPTRPNPALLSLMRFPVSGTPLHPHEKPVEVMAPLVMFAAPVGGLVVDPCCGIGSTLVAAKQIARRALGCEVEERYCEIAANRLRQEVLQFQD